MWGHNGPSIWASVAQRLEQRLEVRLSRAPLSREHPLLVVPDPVEQPHHVAHRAVHLELLHVLGDPLDAVLAPLVEPFRAGARSCPAPPRRHRPRPRGPAPRRQRDLRLRVVPDAVQEAVAAQHRRVAPVQRALGRGRRRAPPGARCRRRSARPARRGRRRCPGACSSCARRGSPSRGTGSRRTARRRRGTRAARCRAAPW